MRTPTKHGARTLVSALAFLALGTPAGNAGTVSSAARLDQPIAATATQDLHEIRHRRHHHYGYGYYDNQNPFTLKDYAPYVDAHPPRYSPRPQRQRSRSCAYWGDRCAENWGEGNSNYYGCMRYEGC
jgi:hypothetical protein